MTKQQDYSRLLDDEFLNAGGRVRIRVVSQGASNVLGVWGRGVKGVSATTILASILAAGMLGAVLTVVIFLSSQNTFYHFMVRDNDQQQEHGVPAFGALALHSDGNPQAAPLTAGRESRGPPSPGAPQDSMRHALPAAAPPPHVFSFNDSNLASALPGFPAVSRARVQAEVSRLLQSRALLRHLQSQVTPPMHQRRSNGTVTGKAVKDNGLEHAFRAHELGQESNESADSISTSQSESHSSHSSNSQETDSAESSSGQSGPSHFLPHRNTGAAPQAARVRPATAKDLGALPRYDQEPAKQTQHALLLCLPSTVNGNTTSNALGQPLPQQQQQQQPNNATRLLTRAQQNVAYSVMEYFRGSRDCHIIILNRKPTGQLNTPSGGGGGVTPDSAANSTRETLIVAPTTAAPVSNGAVAGDVSAAALDEDHMTTASGQDASTPAAVDFRISSSVRPSTARSNLKQPSRQHAGIIGEHNSTETKRTTAKLQLGDQLSPSTPSTDTSDSSEKYRRCNISFHDRVGVREAVDSDLNAQRPRQRDTLVLANGKQVPVVFLRADAFFSESPFGSSWGDLERVRVSGGHRGSSLLELAARTLLVWRHGGYSVDLNASTDHALKTLGMLNRSDATHSYLETTRATLVGAPETCNAVIFELMKTMLKAVRGRSLAGETEEHHHDDDEDVKVFDDVLNAYCRAPTLGPAPRRATTSGVLAVAGADSGARQRRSVTHDGEEPVRSPPPRPLLDPRLRTAPFRLLRTASTDTTPSSGPGPARTLTPSNSTEARELDSTHCRGDLIAISFL